MSGLKSATQKMGDALRWGVTHPPNEAEKAKMEREEPEPSNWPRLSQRRGGNRLRGKERG